MSKISYKQKLMDVIELSLSVSDDLLIVQQLIIFFKGKVTKAQYNNWVDEFNDKSKGLSMEEIYTLDKI